MKHFAAILLFLALLPPVLQAAEPLGRLFFTPAQRNTLDAGKHLARPRQAGPTVRGPRSLTVNGIVTRSDGESTVWVNGSAAGVKRPGSATISATPSGAAAARVQASGTSTRLRVGQTLDRSTGRIKEPYESKSRPPDPVRPDSDSVPAGEQNGDSGGAASAPDQNGDPAAR